MTMGIYKITNLKNDKSYIGLSFDIKRRWKQHLGYAFNTSQEEVSLYHNKLYNAIRKNGKGSLKSVNAVDYYEDESLFPKCYEDDYPFNDYPDRLDAYEGDYSNLCKHSVNHVFSSPTSIINFTSKKPSYDDTRRSGRDNELLQRAQNDL